MALLERVTAAPPAVRDALERLMEDLRLGAGENLLAVVLYGGLARGRYASGPAVAAIAGPLKAAWRAAGVDVMILTPEEMKRAAHFFPIKFLDIQEHHVVLLGDDPLGGLHVPDERLRFGVRQELANIRLRLRRSLVMARGDDALTVRTLARVTRPLALNMAALLRLAGRKPPGDDRSALIFAAAAEAFGLDGAVLSRLAALRHGARLDNASDAALFEGVLAAVSRASEIADQGSGEEA
jgi:hypothetical protein